MIEHLPAIVILVICLALGWQISKMRWHIHCLRSHVDWCHNIFEIAGNERTKAVKVLDQIMLHSDKPEVNQMAMYVIKILRGEERHEHSE